MLREIKSLHGATLRAQDGEIGSVDEILFDDEYWTVRYLVVGTGGWLLGRKALITPSALGTPDWDDQVLNVNLTREQVEHSPSAGTDQPVSRQWETEYYDYYSWPYYWAGTGMGDVPWYSSGLLPYVVADVPAPLPETEERLREQSARRDTRDVHLRSAHEVTGYGITAQDGHLGHVEDFLVDDTTWRIRYLAVDTRDWWPGKKVLLPLGWIEGVSWLDRAVTVGGTRDQVKNSPEWDSSKPISHTFERELSDYSALLRLGAPGSLTARVGADRELSERRLR